MVSGRIGLYPVLDLFTVNLFGDKLREAEEEFVNRSRSTGKDRFG